MRDREIVHLKILLGIAAGPGLLLALPYLLGASDYGRIFGFIAFVQLLSLFSSLGLEVVAARVDLPIRITFFALAFTTLVATIAYELVQSTPTVFSVASMAFCTALANNISLVIQNRYLFNGDTGQYARYGACRAALLIIILLACIRARIDVETSWAIASVASIVVAHLIFQSSKKRLEETSTKQLPLATILNTFYAALPMATLNSLASLPFIAERLIAKTAFDSELFSKYAICTTLITPMVYIGNMSQNYLISHNKWIDRPTAIGGAKQLLKLCGGYIVVLFSVGLPRWR